MITFVCYFEKGLLDFQFDLNQFLNKENKSCMLSNNFCCNPSETVEVKLNKQKVFILCLQRKRIDLGHFL